MRKRVFFAEPLAVFLHQVGSRVWFRYILAPHSVKRSVFSSRSGLLSYGAGVPMLEAGRHARPPPSGVACLKN